MDMSRFSKKIATGERIPEVASGAAKERLPWESTAASSEVPASPFANAMIQKSVMTTDAAGVPKDDENKQNSATPFGHSFAKQPSDHSGNNTKRMIRANGGASTPPFGTSTDPLDAQRQSRPPLERPIAPPGRPSPPRNIPPTRAGPPPTRGPPKKGYVDDDDEEDGSIVQKMMKALPGIPRFSFFRRRQFDSSASATWDAWNAGDSETTEASAGFFGRIFGSKGGRRSSPKAPHKPSAKFMSPPLQSFMDRCDDGKTLSLLKPAERTGSRRIGRTLAALDTVALVFAIIGLKQLPKLEHIKLPQSLSEALRGSLPQFAHCFVAGMDTWAPFAFLATFLTIQTRQLILKAKLRSLTQTLDASISEEAQYGALFLRLYTSSAFVRDISDRLRKAAHSQLAARVDLTRLRALVTIFLASMLLMTVPIFTPLIMALFGTLQHGFDLKLLHSWPIEWNALMANIISSWSAFAGTAKELIAEELEQMSGHPKQVVFGISIAAALLVVSRLPGSSQRNEAAEVTETDEEEDAQFVKFTEQVSNLGISSASRIALLSDAGGIDSALERWRLLIPRGADIAYSRRSLKAILHVTWKGLASAIILALPLLLEHYYSGFFVSSKGSAFPQWGSLMDVSCVLLLTQFLSWKALSSSLLADEYRGAVAGFVMSLRKTANERLSRLNAPPANLQQQVAISPSAGLEVKDLWAAHTTKRAWAVRGVSLECRSGNLLLILGDDSVGKSRLLTTLAETVARPPPQALTTTRVRGNIRVAGIEVNKWDHKLLQKKVWPVLHDVRSMSDFAQILSGMSLEEILEPSGGISYLELSHRPGPNERATMMLALKLAGLYSSLLPKLPSKLSTVVTANEEDTRPSALRPLYSMLSPAEWSKLLLARVFSQAIYENDNSASSSDNLENCLVGSLLLLDDATLYLPEVEEARLIRDLRTTGAATILTSNRWALGRLADQIVVMRDGAILESGTHAELLSRGPQQSLYAAKWHAMTSQ
jgi:ABC-type multidrug transport system fused ATPase/permease subunit